MNLILLDAVAQQGSSTSSFLIMGVMLVGMYFVLWRPQQKKEKETQAMRSKLEVGDEIITRGGIIGRVVSLKDDTIIIETGSDRVKVRISRSYIDINVTQTENKA